jgi:RHS repeat-associated protein
MNGGCNAHHFLNYLSGDAYSAAAVLVKENGGAWNIYYLGRDYQGSITHLIDASGTVVQELSYDPWGRLRNPDNQELYAVGGEPTPFLGRGYTGHEHLTMFGLINMNARLYDPAVGRFLSPDPYVQSPDFSQNFNRYSYCLNNPLRYTDENGKFIFSLFIPVIGVFLDAACWGALIGGAGYTASVAFSNGGFSNWNAGSFWKAVGMGAISGAATFGVGQVFGSVGNFGHEILRAGAHGLVQGGVSALGGGSFGQGFLSGSLGSLGGSAFEAVGGSFARSLAGVVGFSALSGGIGAELSGGDFWRGAATGATIGLLNAGQHLAEKTKNQILAKKAQTIINHPNVEVEGYSTGISQEGDPTVTTVIDARTGDPIEVQTKLGTIGADGSYTVGTGPLQMGTDGRNYIIDLSIPTGKGTTGGFTLKLNSQMVNTLMYYTAPLFVPVLRPVLRFSPVR